MHKQLENFKNTDCNKILIKYGLYPNRIDGMSFDVIKDQWNISKDLSVNYIGKFVRN